MTLLRHSHNMKTVLLVTILLGTLGDSRAEEAEETEAAISTEGDDDVIKTYSYEVSRNVTDSSGNPSVVLDTFATVRDTSPTVGSVEKAPTEESLVTQSNTIPLPPDSTVPSKPNERLYCRDLSDAWLYVIKNVSSCYPKQFEDCSAEGMSQFFPFLIKFEREKHHFYDNQPLMKKNPEAMSRKQFCKEWLDKDMLRRTGFSPPKSDSSPFRPKHSGDCQKRWLILRMDFSNETELLSMYPKESDRRNRALLCDAYVKREIVRKLEGKSRNVAEDDPKNADLDNAIVLDMGINKGVTIFLFVIIVLLVLAALMVLLYQCFCRRGCCGRRHSLGRGWKMEDDEETAAWWEENTPRGVRIVRGGEENESPEE